MPTLAAYPAMMERIRKRESLRLCRAAWLVGVSVREYREIDAGDGLAEYFTNRQFMGALASRPAVAKWRPDERERFEREIERLETSGCASVRSRLRTLLATLDPGPPPSGPPPA